MGKPNKDSRETRTVTTEVKYVLEIIKSKTDAVYIFAFVASVFSRFFDSLSQNRFRKRCNKSSKQKMRSLKNAFYQYRSVKILSNSILCCCLVTKSCSTLCDSMDCSFPGSFKWVC